MQDLPQSPCLLSIWTRRCRMIDYLWFISAMPVPYTIPCRSAMQNSATMLLEMRSWLRWPETCSEENTKGSLTPLSAQIKLRSVSCSFEHHAPRCCDYESPQTKNRNLSRNEYIIIYSHIIKRRQPRSRKILKSTPSLLIPPTARPLHSFQHVLVSPLSNSTDSSARFAFEVLFRLSACWLYAMTRLAHPQVRRHFELKPIFVVSVLFLSG
ncbi:hypothetical protein B0H66DRAFT_64073 [Apodospora peruviana]|uniref:Uncharacterized protein n=1 Tax=Apodospora peruviana TaxID=516989 RepID=A0AAE0MG48_9PEZI|nr:hypothetical protein B0H66DRAFT_64073 [Apodospora peruviana]